MNNFNLSSVPYLNELFPLNINPDEMPISYELENLKEVIISLSEMMITMNKTEREYISDLIQKIAGTHKMLSNMKTAVIDYATKVGQ